MAELAVEAVPGAAGSDARQEADDDLTAFLDQVLRYEPAVEDALKEIFDSSDPLDAPEFDAVGYINKLFPTEHSLASLDETVFSLRKKLRVLDQDIQQGIRQQSNSGAGQFALQTAQGGMVELMTRIENIGSKARASEEMVQEITKGIKSLDVAKRNLTASITTLNHLHMLVGGVESLQTMAEQGLYQEAAHLLAATINVLEHFEGHKDVPQIRELSSKIASIKRILGQQIRMEFRTVYHHIEPDFSGYSQEKLQHACMVLDVLDEDLREGVLEWFVDMHLRDYPRTFAVSGDQATLDKVDRRFAWFKRMVATYLEHSHALFPPSWRMPQRLALRFCEMTERQLREQITNHRDQIDVKLLLFAVQKTSHFEQWLNAKFRYREDEPASAADEIRQRYLRHRREQEREQRRDKRGGDKPSRKKDKLDFSNKISHVFSECLDIYVSAQEENLNQMLDQFARDFKSALMFPDDDGSHDEGAKVLPSSGDMFVFFRNSMVQCSSLSTGQPLFELYAVFKRVLGSYTEQILKANMPKASSLAQLLLKEAELRLSKQEIYLVCSLLNTADYCQDTTRQLEEKLEEKLDEPFKEKLDLKEEQDAFYELIGTCSQVLVRTLESHCDAALSVMSKTRWDAVEEVGDTSPFVSQIGKHVAATVPLGHNRKYFVNFCLKFVNSFGPRIVAALRKCKNISTVGAEQLLLDMQSMVLAPIDLPDMFVQDYVKLIGTDEGVPGFQRVLDMRGVKKSEQQALLAAFREHMGTGSASAAQQEKSKPAKGKSRNLNLRGLESFMKRFPIKGSGSHT
ncbi:uncharacterized protein MONBRDRAFT_26906 [Monosiga brevicollis MX1]|uniref:Vps53 N-terminal domain-containing protein n=1 Tax=Monosiga brevicollis TaxID=81824 RepID=A9V3W0_MONBE|nr:uncharacterized protein MONBRDRAFT_26906 [Monosiga brevicollis MX1]EDQ87874.1 predicted protein [Monosiga brevicollis MX1]|eukprot:XP_001747407.1 hypothetical protein [Monosiga brevicollis MX1]